MSVSSPDVFDDFDSYFPAPFTRAFTTSTALQEKFHNVQIVPLSDKALNVRKSTSGTSHQVVLVPSQPNAQAWRAVYPKGSINPSGAIKGGFGFYMSGPEEFGFETAKEIVFSYAVYFEKDFDFCLGGKLPGPYGGISAEAAYGCTGGRQNERDKCFSLRLMWRDGLGEIYAYLPLTESNDRILRAVPPYSTRNPDYGFSIGRGAWTFERGKWHVVAQRVRLNDSGVENGEIQIWIDGKSAIKVSGVTISETQEDGSTSLFRGAHFQTFFGGSSPQYASPKDQHAYFANVSGAVIN